VRASTASAWRLSWVARTQTSYLFGVRKQPNTLEAQYCPTRGRDGLADSIHLKARTPEVVDVKSSNAPSRGKTPDL
jgi:hypothetical protein